MAQESKMDDIRRATLDRIERNERNYKLVFIAAALLESLFIVGFLMLMDLSNRLHVLLLLATVASYTIIILGLFALGMHVNRTTLRILKAVELIGAQLLKER